MVEVAVVIGGLLMAGFMLVGLMVWSLPNG